MSVILTGNFDGIHIGHAELIRTALRKADSLGEPLYIYTFDNNPKNYLSDRISLNIMPKEDRNKLLLQMGAERVISSVFNASFACMSADEYIDMLILKYGCSCIVCGDNSSFGRNGECTSDNISDYARRHGISAEVVPAVCTSDGTVISSTALRRCISDGDVVSAAEMLGRYFYIKGKVVHGRHDGTPIGFPTLNIIPSAEYAVPKKGVYETAVFTDGHLWRSMTNVGTAPTFTESDLLITETNILFGFDGTDFRGAELYGHTAEISFIRRLRDEQVFKNSEELAARLVLDRENVMSSAVPDCKKIVRL